MSTIETVSVPEAILQAIGALEAAHRIIANEIDSDDPVLDAIGNALADAMVAAYGESPEDDRGYDAWCYDTDSRAERLLERAGRDA